MKFTVSFAIVVAVTASVVGETLAFVPASTPARTSNNNNVKSKTTTMTLSATRRESMETAAALLLGGMVFGPTVKASAEPRPVYLTEPTDEFKQNEAKAMEFKRQQLLIKKEFVAVLDRLVAEPNDEELLVKDLNELQLLIKKTQGLPLGIKKDELFKIIRTKKAKGFWPTSVEIA